MQLCNDDDTIGVARRDIVTLIDLTYPDAAVERRQDPAIGQVDLCGFHGCLIRFHRALILGDESDLSIQRLMRHGVLRCQPLVSRQVDLRALEHGFVARQLSLGLRQCRFIWPRIDLREQIAFLDIITFREIDPLHVTADLRADRHGCERRHGAQCVDVDPDVAFADDFWNDRHRSGIAAVALRRRSLLGPPDDAADDQQDDDGCQDKPSARPRLGGLRGTNRRCLLEVLNRLVHEPAIEMRSGSDCGGFPQFIAGTASRVREPPYLTIPPAVVALTIGKNCTFCLDRDRWATMKTSSEPFIGFKDQAVIRLKQCILNRSEVGDKAAPSAIWGQAPSPEPRRPQAAASSRLNEPLTSALRPFNVMAGPRSLIVARPSATRSSSANRAAAGCLAKGERSAFNASHWSGLRSKSLSSLMLPRLALVEWI